MSLTINDIITRTDLIIRDTSNDSVSAADRLVAISIATQEIMGDFGFDHLNATFDLNFYDTVNYYRIDSDVTDFLEPVDLRRRENKNDPPFSRKDPRELAVELSDGTSENSFAMERKDLQLWLAINFSSEFSATLLHDCDSTAANGTWAVESTNSDATNLTVDAVEFKQGRASLNFDADVSQSSNNRVTIHITSDMSSKNLKDDENLSSLIWEAYIPDVTNFNSITAYWGNSTTVYWSASATTDLNGNSLINGWNEMKVDWANATETGTVDETDIVYLRFDYNYDTAQTDETDFRLDHIRMIRPEVLTLHYQSLFVGQDSASTDIIQFGATDDVPFFSGQYDHFQNPVAYKAASILFQEMGMTEDSLLAEGQYQKLIGDLQKRFPSSSLKETKSFKVLGLNWNKVIK